VSDDQVIELVKQLPPDQQKRLFEFLLTQQWGAWVDLSHYGEERARIAAAQQLRIKFGFEPERARAASDEVRNCSRLMTSTNTLKVVTADPDDDKVVECAVVGGASHIVTGDRRHLLPLGS
jgi:predicted nucleic acid-binding protein